MAAIIFSSENELIDELKKDYAEEPIKPPRKRPILRMAGLLRPIANAPAIRRYYLVATMKDPAGDILRLERYCGDLWGIEERDKSTHDKAEELRGAIEKTCEELFIEVRGGAFD